MLEILCRRTPRSGHKNLLTGSSWLQSESELQGEEVCVVQRGDFGILFPAACFLFFEGIQNPVSGKKMLFTNPHRWSRHFYNVIAGQLSES
jgi:hypothetical protein